MDRAAFDAWRCSVARTAGLIGDPWTLLILRDAHYGLVKFEEFHTSLGLSRNILSERLSRLVARGLLSKIPYQDNPTRAEYRLTGMGDEFFAVLVAMLQWGDRWLDAGDGSPVILHHLTCDHDIEPSVVCTHCGAAVVSSETEFRVGPGQYGGERVGTRMAFPPGRSSADQRS